MTLAAAQAKIASDWWTVPSFASAATVAMTAFQPMLATTIDEADLDQVIRSAEWVAQAKMDGRRLVVSATADGLSFVARDGQPAMVPIAVRRQCERLPVGWTVDGELMPGGKLVAFDLVDVRTP